MASMNGLDEGARKQEHQATNPAQSKEIGYDSPLPQLLAGIDAVCREIKQIVENACSQRLASYGLWGLTKIADGLRIWRDSPDHAPHPRRLDRLCAEEEQQQPTRISLRKRRRHRQLAPTNPNVVYHLGGSRHHGDTWSPAPAITDTSDHAELLRGLENLHDFLRSMASSNPDRAKTIVREYGRAVASTLGATRILSEAPGSMLGASHKALRNWDILKVPRAPAPGLQLPCPSVPIFDVHSVLDTGELQTSLVSMWIADGTYDERVARLRQLADGDSAMFDECMEAIAFAKALPVDCRSDAQTEVFQPTGFGRA